MGTKKGKTKDQVKAEKKQKTREGSQRTKNDEALKRKIAELARKQQEAQKKKQQEAPVPKKPAKKEDKKEDKKPGVKPLPPKKEEKKEDKKEDKKPVKPPVKPEPKDDSSAGKKGPTSGVTSPKKSKDDSLAEKHGKKLELPPPPPPPKFTDEQKRKMQERTHGVLKWTGKDGKELQIKGKGNEQVATLDDLMEKMNTDSDKYVLDPQFYFGLKAIRREITEAHKERWEAEDVEFSKQIQIKVINTDDIIERNSYNRGKGIILKRERKKYRCEKKK